MEEKLNYNKEIFFLDCMRQTKEGIYARAEEICVKNKLVPMIKEYAEQEACEEKIAALDNILDSAYCYIITHGYAETRLENLVQQWVTSF